MYTQCPQCQTVFRVTATMLKAARGKVRCGRCAHVFNALTFLIDSDESVDQGSAPGGAPAPADQRADHVPPPPATTPSATTPLAAVPPAASTAERPPVAEKRYDDNTPFEEDDELQAAEPDADGEPEPIAEEIVLDSGADPDDELVLETGDDEAADDAPIDEELTLEGEPADESGAAEQDVPESALEFTAADLNKVFVQAPRVPIDRPARDGADDADDETAEHEILDVELETPSSPEVITLEGESVVVVDDDGAGEATPLEADAPGREASPRKPQSREAIDLEVRREIEKAFADDPATRAEFVLPSGKRVSLHREQGEVEVEEVEAAETLERDTSRQRRNRIAWGAGGVALLLLLGLQVLHYNRQAIVQSAQFGPALTRVYGAFGSELTPAWKVDAYDVRQWGAAADPRSGTVKVRASVTNGAEHAQPYPLLRLTLMNRFGERLRQSDIEPKDYLTRAPGAGQLLGAGQRVDASIAIVDPGDDAVNFEIDVCLRRNAAVTCASDALRQRS